MIEEPLVRIIINIAEKGKTIPLPVDAILFLLDISRYHGILNIPKSLDTSQCAWWILKTTAMYKSNYPSGKAAVPPKLYSPQVSNFNNLPLVISNWSFIQPNKGKFKNMVFGLLLQFSPLRRFNFHPRGRHLNFNVLK